MSPTPAIISHQRGYSAGTPSDQRSRSFLAVNLIGGECGRDRRTFTATILVPARKDQCDHPGQREERAPILSDHPSAGNDEEPIPSTADRLCWLLVIILALLVLLLIILLVKRR